MHRLDRISKNVSVEYVFFQDHLSWKIINVNPVIIQLYHPIIQPYRQSAFRNGIFIKISPKPVSYYYQPPSIRETQARKLPARDKNVNPPKAHRDMDKKNQRANEKKSETACRYIYIRTIPFSPVPWR